MYTGKTVSSEPFIDILRFLLVTSLLLFPLTGYATTYNVKLQVVDSNQDPVHAKILFLGLDEDPEITYQYFPNFNQIDFDPESNRYWTGSFFATIGHIPFRHSAALYRSLSTPDVRASSALLCKLRLYYISQVRVAPRLSARIAPFFYGVPHYILTLEDPGGIQGHSNSSLNWARNQSHCTINII